MNLVRTSILNGAAVFIRMLSLLGINKVVAIYVGPVGYAIVGQFYNAVQMITTFASGAINVGVVRYTAEYKDDEAKLHKIWRTAGTIALIGSFVSSLVIAIFNKQFAVYFLKDETLGGVFLWFASALILFVINTLLLAILNGKKEIKKYVVANITGSILSLILTVGLAIKFGLYGALVALGIYQSIAFFVTLVLCLKTSWFRLSFLFGEIDREIAKNLIRYTFMSLAAAISLPFSHVLLRNHLGAKLGWVEAGYWEAIWKFSSAYMILITSTLSVYYLPRISEQTDKNDVKNEIIHTAKFVVPVAFLFSVMAYFLRVFIIKFLFTDSFLPIEELFAWQVVGDFLKVTSWLLAYVVLGKGMMKYYVITEITICFSYVLIVMLLLPYFGLQATAIGHAFNYTVYLVTMFAILRREKYL